MCFQNTLSVALSTWKQSILVVVSPIQGVQAAPFHPGGFWGPTSALPSSSVPLCRCCCASHYGAQSPFAYQIVTLNVSYLPFLTCHKNTELLPVCSYSPAHFKLLHLPGSFVMLLSEPLPSFSSSEDGRPAPLNFNYFLPTQLTACTSCA